MAPLGIAASLARASEFNELGGDNEVEMASGHMHDPSKPMRPMATRTTMDDVTSPSPLHFAWDGRNPHKML